MTEELYDSSQLTLNTWRFFILKIITNDHLLKSSVPDVYI